MSQNPLPNETSEFAEEATSRIGQVLAFKYHLEAVLGSGGMAHVFRATNTVIGRTVAIKILHGEHAKVREIVERFLREARTANIVRHPNIIDVIDVGQDADGTPFIVQELLEGETLYQYACRKQGVVPLSELSEIIGPVLSAVGEAHAHGIVHRDLKPENVFLAGQRGRRIPKVLDFGISKVRGAEMTVAGMMLGTPAYMAPELARSSKDADPRSDVWAIGVMLFEILTGVVPFEGATVAHVFMAIASTDAARLIDVRPEMPEALSRIVERCLKRNPAERYLDARELAADLDPVLETLKRGSGSEWSGAPTSRPDQVRAVIPGQHGTLYSRLQTEVASGVANTSGDRVSLPEFGRSDSQVNGHRNVPSGVTTTPFGSAGRPASSSRMVAGAQHPSSARMMHGPSTPPMSRVSVPSREPSAVRRKPPLAQRIQLIHAFAIVGVGLLLAVAILVAFRIAR